MSENLKNSIERLVVTCRDDCITADVLSGFPQCISSNGGQTSISSLKQSRDLEEKQIISDAYRGTGNTRKAAEILGISQSSVVKKMKKYGINIKKHC